MSTFAANKATYVRDTLGVTANTFAVKAVPNAAARASSTFAAAVLST